MAADPVVPLVATLRDLARWLRTTRAPGAILGGVAPSQLGRPRCTRDVDALVFVDEDAWPDFV